MKFKATQAQLQHLFAIATNASRPAGLGFMHYTPRTFTAAEFEGVRSVDYVEGRMVKLSPRFVEDGVFEIGDPAYVAGDMERTYQSWGGEYPTARALIEAAGLTPLDAE